MESFKVENLTFSYPGREKNALDGLSFSVERGQFITLCGPSGCGKTTLLRHLKPDLAPHGKLSGAVFFEGRPLAELGRRGQCEKIGFVMQSPESQIVTDTVWHELAFGLESLGLGTSAVRLRVAETASYFGIGAWFDKKVTELSGGQKQILALASVTAMQPSVLLLDEPTSQLDPIAASAFISAVTRLNRELGITVVMTEHRLDEAFPVSDRVLVMDGGRLICDAPPAEAGRLLKKARHGMFLSMPVPMRIYAGVENELDCPVTAREGRLWLDGMLRSRAPLTVPKAAPAQAEEHGVPAAELKDTWFRYEREAPDVVRGLSLKVFPGELYAVLGGNGAGKTTALSLVAGLNRPYRGTVKASGGRAVLLPQNPQALFVRDTVREDLLEMLPEKEFSSEAREARVREVSGLCRIGALLPAHPYDLSGGELQRAALAKVLLTEPRLLLLDEPTKGMDGRFKREFAEILRALARGGAAVVMASHDIEFCAEYADRCGLFFDGHIVSSGLPRAFFQGNGCYTTAANRMARHVLPGAVTAGDVIRALGGSEADTEPEDPGGDEPPQDKPDKAGAITPLKALPARGRGRRPSKRTCIAAAALFAAVPATIYIGMAFLGDRKYFFISTLILLETLLPFFVSFEGRSPQAREMVVIAVLAAFAVAGRAAFFMLPQFKPEAAIVVIAGAAFGGEAGFLVGAVSAFASNMFFGQGPWTPWQMFALGAVGFLAGALFNGAEKKSTAALCLFGGAAVLLVYGGVMNPAAVLMFQNRPTPEMFLLAYIRGIPFDLIHAAATVIFLKLLSAPLLKRLGRLKTKYGLTYGGVRETKAVFSAERQI